jgi:REP element-mobilizing transposase RayT
MARALRVLVPGAWYHVVNRGVERRLIFYGQAYYQRFEELLGLMVQQFGVRIHTDAQSLSSAACQPTREP